MTAGPPSAKSSGEFRIAGELAVTRLGLGSTQLAGRGARGPARDPRQAVRVLRRAVDLGVNLIDVADSDGHEITEPLINRALYPYPADLVIAIKAGLIPEGPSDRRPVGRAGCLRQQAEMSLRHLGLEQIKLFQLHRIDAKVPLEDQVGALKVLQDEGKIGHIGLSDVDVDQLQHAQMTAPIASVQNLYNLANRSAETLLAYAERQGIAFIPCFPLATGALATPDSPLATFAAQYRAIPAQMAIAWLLRRSPVLLPVPGTSNVAHLEANISAAELILADDDYRELGAVSS
jgi:pyridoxine 4-dehydrogenase